MIPERRLKKTILFNPCSRYSATCFIVTPYSARHLLGILGKENVMVKIQRYQLEADGQQVRSAGLAGPPNDTQLQRQYNPSILIVSRRRFSVRLYVILSPKKQNNGEKMGEAHETWNLVANASDKN